MTVRESYYIEIDRPEGWTQEQLLYHLTITLEDRFEFSDITVFHSETMKPENTRKPL